MKVLFLTNLPAPYRVDYFNELSKYVDLTVAYERKNAISRNQKWKSKKTGNYSELFLKSKNIGDDNSISFQIIDLIKKNKFDYIIIGQYSTFTAMLAILYMKIKKIPFILNSDGGFIKKNEKKIKYKIKKYLISSADYWLSSGSNTTNYLKYYGADQNKIFEYPFTSLKEKDILTKPLSDSEKITIRKELNLPVDKKIVISVGRFLDWKGFDILLKASKKFNDNIILLLIGDKPTSKYLEIIEESNKNNVVFPGFLTKEELIKYYKSSDLFVLPTKDGIWELVVNEAMSFALPIITTTKCGSAFDLVKNEYNGYIINDLDDINKYSALINNYFEKKENQKMSENSLKIIKEYTIENMAKRTYDILKEIGGEEQ